MDVTTEVAKRKKQGLCLHKRFDPTLDPYCPLHAEPGTDHCILHIDDPEKDQDKFRKILKDILDAQKDAKSEVFDIEGYVFPFQFIYKDWTWDLVESIKAHRTIFYGSADFSKTEFFKSAHFPGAIFAREAYFQQSKFGVIAYFYNAQFKSTVTFELAVFDCDAWFNSAVFIKNADFSSVAFKAKADFNFSKFLNNAIFICTNFLDTAQFLGTDFDSNADFDNSNFASCGFGGAKFLAITSFSNAKFEKVADLNRADFNKVFFNETVFNDRSIFNFARFNQCYFRQTKFLRQVSFVSATIDRASFDQCQFEQGVNFNQTNLGKTFFLNLTFPKNTSLQFAEISSCEFVQCDLSRVIIGCSRGLESCRFVDVNWCRAKSTRWTVADEYIFKTNKASPYSSDLFGISSTFEIIGTAYRELKVNYECHKDFPTAGHFHYGEMEMRRLAKGSILRRTIGSLEGWYYLLSGYGERAWRALVSFVFVFVVFASIYSNQGFINKKPNLIAIQANAPVNKQYKNEVSHNYSEALIVSARVALLRADVFSQSTNRTTTAAMIFESILGPLTLGLFALAVRRKVKRN